MEAFARNQKILDSVVEDRLLRSSRLYPMERMLVGKLHSSLADGPLGSDSVFQFDAGRRWLATAAPDQIGVVRVWDLDAASPVPMPHGGALGAIVDWPSIATSGLSPPSIRPVISYSGASEIRIRLRNPPRCLTSCEGPYLLDINDAGVGTAWQLTEAADLVEGCCVLQRLDSGLRGWWVGNAGQASANIEMPCRSDASSPVDYDSARGRLAIGLDDGQVWTARFTSDGKQSVAGGTQILTQRVIAVTFDQHSGRLASAGSFLSESIVLTDFGDGDEPPRSVRIGAHNDWLPAGGQRILTRALAFSSDGNLLASGGEDSRRGRWG